VKIDAAPEAVWGALIDPRELAAWFGAEGAIDPRLGGAVHFRFTDGTERRGLVVEFDPPRRLAFRWRELRTSGAGLTPGEARVVTFTLEPEGSVQGEGTRVIVTESNGILSDDPPFAMAERG
jgi:uncharacterized protein YndB with AHSA1/START domain